MIEYLRGKIADIDINRVVIDVNGVGYVLTISDSTASLLPGVGEEAKIYSFLSVREDGVTLYGFPSYDDLGIFKQLITVSGIGPKGALAILSVLTPDDLRFAILSGDSKAIAKAPGIGKRTAERVILDLKDRIGAESSENALMSGSSPAPSVNESSRDEAVEALVALGYSSADAYRAVKEASAAIGGDTETDTLLKAALKVIL
ncbi:MAG: Holliday junction branch migration protein RuvA [Lachnospiraceae bacterium]|nr:Holliday junction branch migration protein RuvA [Lachnospiraceae bacterium]